MKRSEQIEAALAILRPDAGQTELFRREVAESLKQIDSYVAAFDSKPLPKRKVERYADTLRRALKIDPQPDLEFTAAVEGRIARLRKLAAPPPSWLDEDQVKRPKPAAKRSPPRRRALRQKFAVIEAEALLINLANVSAHELPKKGIWPGLTRKGPWHRLAAVLYGDDGMDLFNHMRASRRI